MKTQRKLLTRLKSLDFNDGHFIEAVEALFKNGLDPNLPSDFNKFNACSALLNFMPSVGYEHPTPEDSERLSRKYFELVNLFIAQGFDPTRNNGAYGQDILWRLPELGYNAWIPKIADILIKQGADPRNGHIPFLIRSMTDYRWECIYEDGYYSEGSACELLRRVYGRAAQELPYTGLATYHSFIGKTVTDIKLILYDADIEWKDKAITSENADEARYGRDLILFSDDFSPLILAMGELPLIDPYWNESDSSWGKPFLRDFPFYDYLKGHRLVDVEISNHYQKKGWCGTKLKFSNGDEL